MSARLQKILDILFGFQILGALVFCGAQSLRSLSDVHGVSIVQNGFVLLYLCFHLALGLSAHRVKASRLTVQAISIYVIWMIATACVIVAILLSGMYRWSTDDTIILASGVILTSIIVGIATLLQRKVTDPMMRSFCAIAYKSVPQVLLALKIWHEGGSGIPLLTVAIGHMTILFRLVALYFLVLEAGWDRNRKWLAVSEFFNEASWCVATLAWIYV